MGLWKCKTDLFLPVVIEGMGPQWNEIGVPVK